MQRGQVSDDNPKPKRASLPKGQKPEDLSLDDALGLLRLPRHLGEHPDGGKVQAGLGRFGPYVVWDKGKGEKDYRSLKGEDDVLAVGSAGPWSCSPCRSVVGGANSSQRPRQA